MSANFGRKDIQLSKDSSTITTSAVVQQMIIINSNQISGIDNIDFVVFACNASGFNSLNTSTSALSAGINPLSTNVLGVAFNKNAKVLYVFNRASGATGAGSGTITTYSITYSSGVLSFLSVHTDNLSAFSSGKTGALAFNFLKNELAVSYDYLTTPTVEFYSTNSTTGFITNVSSPTTATGIDLNPIYGLIFNEDENLYYTTGVDLSNNNTQGYYYKIDSNYNATKFITSPELSPDGSSNNSFTIDLCKIPSLNTIVFRGLVFGSNNNNYLYFNDITTKVTTTKIGIANNTIVPNIALAGIIYSPRVNKIYYGDANTTNTFIQPISLKTF
jgi:hypothetical protein